MFRVREVEYSSFIFIVCEITSLTSTRRNITSWKRIISLSQLGSCNSNYDWSWIRLLPNQIPIMSLQERENTNFRNLSTSSFPLYTRCPLLPPAAYFFTSVVSISERRFFTAANVIEHEAETFCSLGVNTERSYNEKPIQRQQQSRQL